MLKNTKPKNILNKANTNKGIKKLNLIHENLSKHFLYIRTVKNTKLII